MALEFDYILTKDALRFVCAEYVLILILHLLDPLFVDAYLHTEHVAHSLLHHIKAVLLIFGKFDAFSSSAQV